MARKDSKGRNLKTGESQRSDGRYQFSKMINGKRYTIYNMDLAELRKEELKLLSSVDDGSIKAKKSKMTVDDYFNFWLDTYASNGRKLSTQERYSYYYKKYMSPHIGHIKLIHLVKSDIQKVINDMVKDNLSFSTIRISFSPLSQALEYAVDDDLILKNPAKCVELPANDTKTREAISVEQVELFFKALSTYESYKRYLPMYRILFNTGMRISELCALTWEDVNLKERTITIRYIQKKSTRTGKDTYYLGTPKSKKSARTIPMNDTTLKAFKELKKDVIKFNRVNYSLPIFDESGREIGRRNNFIFFTSKGTIITSNGSKDIIHSVREKFNADVTNNKGQLLEEFTTHQTRHTFTSLAYEAGIDVKYTSDMLGHSTVELTMNRYTHLSETKKKEQLRKINMINIS